MTGNLNDKELAAVGDLLTHVDVLATKFFSGDVQAALTAASQIGVDSDQIAGLHLNLTYSQILRAAASFAPALVATATPPTQGTAASPATTPSQPTALPPATLRVETEEKFVEGLTGFRSDLVLSDFQPASLRRACGARLNTDTATSRPRYKW